MSFRFILILIILNFNPCYLQIWNPLSSLTNTANNVATWLDPSINLQSASDPPTSSGGCDRYFSYDYGIVYSDGLVTIPQFPQFNRASSKVEVVLTVSQYTVSYQNIVRKLILIIIFVFNIYITESKWWNDFIQ
jgi:hypothetical protein